MKNLIFTSIIILITFTIKCQSFDVEAATFPGVNRLIIKSFNGCYSRGFRSVYTFNKNGQAIESSNFNGRKLLAIYRYEYNTNGLLIRKVQIYSINHKDNIDTTNFLYGFDSQGRVISKSIEMGHGLFVERYECFDLNNFPTEVTSTINGISTTLLKEYDSLGKEIVNQKIENDSIVTLEEKRYNRFGDIVYSIIPLLVGKDKTGLAIFIGGSRYSAVEEYDYIYDKENRWTKKYVVFNGKKLLIEERIFK